MYHTPTHVAGIKVKENVIERLMYMVAKILWIEQQIHETRSINCSIYYHSFNNCQWHRNEHDIMYRSLWKDQIRNPISLIMQVSTLNHRTA